jgi:hypothetical protein
MAEPPKRKARGERRDGPPEARPRERLNLNMKYLVVSGKDEMKISRSVEAKVEDLSLTGLVFETNTMKVDGLHLSYDESPLLRNRLTMEIELPNRRKITAIGEGYRARIRNHGHSCFLCEIVIRSQFHTTYEPEA